MPSVSSQQAAALRQAVLIIAFLVSLAAMGISLARGSDLLHAAFTALWVLPISSFVIYHVFRTWFLVLMRSVQEKQMEEQKRQQEEQAAAAQNK
jgi:hypothetical protein